MTDATCISAIRCLCADVVAGAKSGHPGAPLGMAPAAHVLFSRMMNFDCKDKDWINRDRFILSNGHGCALLYSMLHLCGYEYTMDDLKAFRQIGSKTPGHPERGPKHPGVEVTTGPLGQGIAQAAGIALAEKHMAERFNKPGHELFNHFTYVFCGDGCLQEGVACEATSLAGHLKLGKLIVVYDDNKITIDGSTDLSFTEDTATKMKSLGWHTVTVNDGNTDLAGIEAALKECQAETTKPSMILLKTIIGYGSKLQGTAKVHGAPMVADDIKQLKEKCGFSPDLSYNVPQEVYAAYAKAQASGTAKANQWRQLYQSYAKAHPAEFKELDAFLSGKLPENWATNLPLSKEGESLATRKCSEIALQALMPRLTNMIGGSADLTGSNLTKTKDASDITQESAVGRYIRFGVREHAMTAMSNGIASYGGLIPFVATFFNFITYAWGAVRVGALSGNGTIFVATHDSIGLGEDGPTHQPVEVPALCRATPNLLYFRPADQTEVTASYIIAIENRDKVSVIALSRQAVPMLPESSVQKVRHGAYVIYGDASKASVIIASTGTEVATCIDAAKALGDLNAAVVSMPCSTLFDQQPSEYKASVFPKGIPVLGVEPFNKHGWSSYCHYFLGLPEFGLSAPAKDIYKHFGITADNIAAKARALSTKLGKSAPDLSPLEL